MGHLSTPAQAAPGTAPLERKTARRGAQPRPGPSGSGSETRPSQPGLPVVRSPGRGQLGTQVKTAQPHGASDLQSQALLPAGPYRQCAWTGKSPPSMPTPGAGASTEAGAGAEGRPGRGREGLASRYSQESRQGVQVPRHSREPQLGAVGGQHDAVLLAVAGGRAGGRPRAGLGGAAGARGGAQRGAKPQRAEPRRAAHLSGRLRGTWRPGGRCSPQGPAARPAGCAVGGDQAAGSARWRRRQERGARAVREGQALRSDPLTQLRRLGKGGRHRRRRSQRTSSLPLAPLPSFLPSWHEFHPGKKKKRGGTQRECVQPACEGPAFAQKRCPTD